MKVKLDQLKDLKYDQSCKFCMENVFVKDAIEIKDSYPKQQALLESCNTELSNLDSIIKDLQSYKQKKTDYDKKTKQLQSIEKELDKIKLDQSKLEFKIKQSRSLLDHIEYKIELYKKQQTDIKNNKAINIKIDSLNNELSTINASIKQQNSLYTDVVSNKKLEEGNKTKYENSIKKLKELEAKFKIYQYYLQAIHRDGIPHKLITNIIPVVEEEINNILGQLVDFTISLRSDEKNINAYICYSEDNCWPIELTSGMEKFISSLAIRSALINISTLPRPNFIAIDEGFGALDQTNLSSIVMLFDYLKSQFKFITIISHIETMRDIVDHHIEINKVNGRSKIEQLD
jgi:DNA repair exonuclease SbcCD ATPase subunit